MAKRKKKKEVDWAASLHRLLSFQIVGILLLIALASSNSQVWAITSSTFILPMNSEILSQLLDIFGGYRIVWPDLLFHPFMFFISFLNPAVLLLAAALVYKLLPGSSAWRSIGAFAFGVFFLPQATPGTLSNELLFLSASLFALVPLLKQNLSPLLTWFLATSGSLLALYPVPELWPLLFWVTLSMMFASVLQYLFAQKGALLRYQRQFVVRSFSQAIGSIALGFWVLLLFFNVGLKDISPSSHLWLPWVVALSAAFLTWRSPWSSIIYLRLTIFAQGLLFFQGLEIAVFLLLGWLGIRIIQEILKLDKIKAPFQEQSNLISFVAQTSFLIVLLGLLTWNLLNLELKRELDPGWASVLKSIQKSDDQGFLVVGDGLPLLAHFHKARFVRNNELALEDSQVRLTEALKERGLDSILVENEHIRRLWKQKLAEGYPAKRINESVLSRMILYEGKTVKTSTLHLPPVIDFELQKLDRNDYSWISMKRP